MKPLPFWLSSPKGICGPSQRRVIFLALVLIPTTAHPQGCPQCKDSTAATPPATQSAYREAILFLGGAAGTVFLATLVLLKRHR